MPPLLKKDKILSLRRLYFYSKDREAEPQNRLIYFIKKNRTNRVNNFVAGELLPLINAELGRFEINEIPLIVGVPRSSGSLTEYGFDQSKDVCVSLAQRLGATYCGALGRKFGGSEQKKLGAAQRKKNIANLIYLRENMQNMLKGRYVLLFDDVVTTGASMSVCVSALRRAGVKGVVCLTLASDIKKEISASR
jgi:ComF family protein